MKGPNLVARAHAARISAPFANEQARRAVAPGLLSLRRNGASVPKPGRLFAQVVPVDDLLDVGRRLIFLVVDGRVEARAAVNAVAAGLPVEAVVAGAAEQRVVARAAEQHVIAVGEGPVPEPVVAEEQVVEVAAGDLVVAGAAVGGIAAGRSLAGREDDRVVARLARGGVAGRAARRRRLDHIVAVTRVHEHARGPP